MQHLLMLLDTFFPSLLTSSTSKIDFTYSSLLGSQKGKEKISIFLIFTCDLFSVQSTKINEIILAWLPCKYSLCRDTGFFFFERTPCKGRNWFTNKKH